MEKQYEKKLLDSILQTGFPLELELVETLRKREHLTYPNVSFQSPDNGIKELDIVAMIQKEEKQWQRGPVSIQLLIECKKSSKYPWIFFEEGYSPLNDFGVLSKADYSSDFVSMNGVFNPLMGCQNSEFSDHHYNDFELPKVRTYIEGFKEKSNEPTAIFKAVMNIFHGRRFLQGWFGNSSTRNNGDKRKRTILHHYCIVLDGDLILARKQSDTFELLNPDHLLLLAIDTIGEPQYTLTGNEILIDVIKKEYFNSYLDIVNKEAEKFCEHLKVVENSEMAKGLLF